MITKIGLVAGDIWNYLESHEKKTQLTDLFEGIDHEKDLILMSLGWLAREGHIVLEGEKEKCSITLTS